MYPGIAGPARPACIATMAGCMNMPELGTGWPITTGPDMPIGIGAGMPYPEGMPMPGDTSAAACWEHWGRHRDLPRRICSEGSEMPAGPGTIPEVAAGGMSGGATRISPSIAWPNSCMVWIRWLRSFSIALRQMASSSGGTGKRGLGDSVGLAPRTCAWSRCPMKLSAWKGNLAGQHLVDDAAQGIDVDAMVGNFAARLLWRHVFGRSEDHAGSRQTAAVVVDVVDLGDAKIEDLHEVRAAIFIDEIDVLGLEISVNDAFAVR